MNIFSICKHPYQNTTATTKKTIIIKLIKNSIFNKTMTGKHNEKITYTIITIITNMHAGYCVRKTTKQKNPIRRRRFIISRVKIGIRSANKSSGLRSATRLKIIFHTPLPSRIRKLSYAKRNTKN